MAFSGIVDQGLRDSIAHPSVEREIADEASSRNSGYPGSSGHLGCAKPLTSADRWSVCRTEISWITMR